MFGKPPITALQEYCAKKYTDLPVYKSMESNDGSKSFICQVEALNTTAEGSGRSKKEARHDAAANLIKKAKLAHPDLDNIPQAQHGEIPTTDAVINLRDICVQKDHPLPSFELVQQGGPPESPEFTVQCTVASIVRIATATTKKAAKQKAAQLVINLLQSFQVMEENMQVVSLEATSTTESEENRRRFKTYREYIESDCKDEPGTLLTDRHKYFEKYEPEIKLNARKVLNAYHPSDREKVLQLLSVLGLKYKMEPIDSSSSEAIYMLQLLCGYDVCFCGTTSVLYSNVIRYFIGMI